MDLLKQPYQYGTELNNFILINICAQAFFWMAFYVAEFIIDKLNI